MIGSLSILLTDKCNLHCEHCIVRASPTGKRVFDEQYVENIVESMREFGLKHIGITGGEPLLHRELLERICKRFREAGISSFLATNAHWASSPQSAAKLMRELSRCGVARLNLSVDEYHQKGIPIRNVCNAAMAAAEQGIDYEVHISAFDTETARFYLGVLRRMSIRNIYIGAIERAGRAAELDSESPEKMDLQVIECQKVENPIVLLNGKVVACCDLLVAPEYEPKRHSPLCLGNIRNESLRDILHRASNNLCLALLRSYGPDGLWRKLTRINNWLDIEKKPYDGCKLCYWLFDDPQRASAVLSTLERDCLGSRRSFPSHRVAGPPDASQTMLSYSKSWSTGNQSSRNGKMQRRGEFLDSCSSRRQA